MISLVSYRAVFFTSAGKDSSNKKELERGKSNLFYLSLYHYNWKLYQMSNSKSGVRHRKNPLLNDKDQTYVALYRVSTNSVKQALSFPYQKESIERFIQAYGGEVIQEFHEEVSGTSIDRELLEQAVDMCLGTDSILLVHKLSRLSRNGLQAVAYLEEKGVDYIEASSPHDSQFVKGIKLLQAKDENDTRKGHIKSALDQIKRNIARDGYHISKSGRKITTLGTKDNLTPDARKKGDAAKTKKARNNPNNLRALTVVDLMFSMDKSYSEMARHLNDNGFRSSRGAEWDATKVKNLLRLYNKELYPSHKHTKKHQFKKK